MNRASETYRRILTLAQGGMGTVELALRSDGTFRRLYAVKRLRELFEDDPGARAMFLDEARLAGLIRHANVVSVLDIGEDERGPFLVMELIDGVSAGALLASLSKTAEHLPIALVLRIAADVARGLHAAHELRTPEGEPLALVHRDVSPQNILLGFDGSVRVTDFGIAKAIGRLTHTDAGLLKGKLGYMSPEQLRFHEVDRRSDLFALGIVLYELATSTRLYPADDAIPAPRRILEEGPPDPGERRSDLPPPLVELMFEMLAKEPAERPASAREVAERLDAIRVDIEAEEGPLDLADYLCERFAEQRRERQADIAAAMQRLSTPPPPAPRSPSRARPAAIAVLVALLIGGAVVAAFFAAQKPEPDAGAITTSAPPRATTPPDGPSADEAIAGDATEPPSAPETAEPRPTRARERRRARPARRAPTAPRASEREREGDATEMRAPSLWEW